MVRGWMWAVVAMALVTGQARSAEAGASAAPPSPFKEIQVAQEAFDQGSPPPSWVTPIAAPTTEQRTPIAIRLFDTQLNATGAHTAYVRRVLQVNDSSALSSIGQFSIGFVPQYQKLHLHALRILRGDTVLDQTRTVRMRFLQREDGLERGLYSGTVSASGLVDDLRVGDSLELAYSTEGHNPVFGETYTDEASWDTLAPMSLRHLVLIHAADRPIQWRLLGESDPAKQPQPRITQNKGLRTLVFERRNAEGIDAEPQLPSNIAPYRYIQFTEHKDWRSVAKWADGLFPPVQPLPAEITNLITQLRKLPDAQAQAVAALQWVQKEIRYFSVSMGESSHRPHAPAEVLKQRMGDCKDKTYLLLTILRALGMDAQPVLLSTQLPRWPSQSLPTTKAFDHVILALHLDGQTHYLDATRSAQVGPLARMGLVIEGADALVVSPNTQALSQLHWPQAAELNTIDLSEAFTVDEMPGKGRLVATNTWHGGNAESMRQLMQQLTPGQWRRYALSTYERRYPGIDLERDPELKDDALRNEVTMVTRYSIPSLSTESDNGWIVRYAPANIAGFLSLPPNVRRQHPALVAAHPFRATYQATVGWPSKVASFMDPIARSVHNEVFDLDVNAAFRGTHASVNMVLQTRSQEVSAQALPGLVQDVTKAGEAVGTYVFVSRSAIKSSIGANATVKETLLARGQAYVATLSKTIQGNTLKGDDLAEAYCSRAETQAELGHYTEGIKDADEATKLAPSLPRAWECKGNAYGDAGDFDRSNTYLTKALTLGASPSTVGQRRGLARFYLGRYADAAKDFSMAAQSVQQAQSPEAIYPSLWWGWALQRTGQPLPPALSQWARKDPRGAWPRPALALMAGVISPQDMMDEVLKGQGDEREMNLSEAWFYVGQHHLMAGRKAQAREAFEKCQRQGITMYLEHMAAGWELQRLAAP